MKAWGGRVGVGIGNGASQLFCPQRVISVTTTSHRRAPGRVSSFPYVPLDDPPDHLLSAARVLACLFPTSRVGPQGFIPATLAILLNFSLWALLVAKAYKNQPLWFFQPVDLGKCSFCLFPCTFPTPPLSATMTPSPQHLESISSPIHVSPTILHVASSLPVVVQFVVSCQVDFLGVDSGLIVT